MHVYFTKCIHVFLLIFFSGRGVSTPRKTAISRCLADTSSEAAGRRVRRQACNDGDDVVVSNAAEWQDDYERWHQYYK